MKIRRVDVRYAHEFGPRVVAIELDGGISVSGPDRALNSSELNYKTRGICWQPFDHTVFEYVKNLDARRLRNLRGRNGPMASEVQKASATFKKTSGKVHVFFPRLEDFELPDSDVRTLIDLQGLSGADLICLPDPRQGTALDRFEQVLQRGREYVEMAYGTNVDTFPLMSMREAPDRFAERVEKAIDMGFKLIGFRYASPAQAYSNYRYLSDHNRDEVWFHLSGVERYWRVNYTTSQLHIPQFAGVDTVALDVPKGGRSRGTDYHRVKRFDSRSIGHLDRASHVQRHGQDLGCDCQLCAGKTLDQFFEQHVIGPRSQRPQITRLRRIAVIHEAFSSRNEFAASRDAIESGEVLQYIRSKEFLPSALQQQQLVPP